MADFYRLNRIIDGSDDGFLRIELDKHLETVTLQDRHAHSLPGTQRSIISANTKRQNPDEARVDGTGGSGAGRSWRFAEVAGVSGVHSPPEHLLRLPHALASSSPRP